MRIEIKARKVAVSDDLRKRVEKRFEKIAKQVSPLAELEVELSEDRNPRISDSQIVEATLGWASRRWLLFAFSFLT